MSNILRSQDGEADAVRPPILSHLAGNVRRHRKARGFSQSILAARASLSRRMIVAIEASEANVSLSTVDRLAAALGISFAELIRAPEAPDSRSIETLAWCGSHPDSQATLLGAAPATREAELWTWVLGPGERYPSEADSVNWHEMLLVIEGVLTIELADGERKLGAGEFFIFSSAAPYVFANTGAGAVRYVRNVVL